jgi:hypothetical protein
VLHQCVSYTALRASGAGRSGALCLHRAHVTLVLHDVLVLLASSQQQRARGGCSRVYVLACVHVCKQHAVIESHLRRLNAVGCSAHMINTAVSTISQQLQRG